MSEYLRVRTLVLHTYLAKAVYRVGCIDTGNDRRGRSSIGHVFDGSVPDRPVRIVRLSHGARTGGAGDRRV